MFKLSVFVCYLNKSHRFGHSDGAFLSFIWVGGGEGGAKHEIDSFI